MASIGIEQVTKVYDDGFEAVADVSIEVADGEFMVLVGPSGCGKTTLLRMVAGLEHATNGTVAIGDTIVNDVDPRDRDIAMVFQNYALYPNMTVAENIGFALRLRRLPREEIGERVAAAARVLSLGDYLDRKPSQLSGGQRQRVAMGRAIVREPKAFLMDEPLSNLDAKLRVQMRAEVARVQRRLGVATLYVTHDQVEAMTMGDRVTVMRAGRVQQCATPQELYDRPANMFVAGFIGSPAMNLYRAVIAAGAESVRIGSQDIALPERLRLRCPQLLALAEQEVVVGLRPEHLPIAADATGSTLEGEVTLIEALGSELLVHFTIDARRVLPEDVAGELEELGDRGEGIARVAPRSPVAVGDRARFAVEPESLHFFDPADGRALERA
jgi:multiple sugar transport system ATP-binding protein